MNRFRLPTLDPYLNRVARANLDWRREAELCPQQADLSGANLSSADLAKASLTEANLSGAQLVGANLTGANLENANLTGANLNGADLRLADLELAKLSGAALPDADLTGANLDQADMPNATLDDADLAGARLREAKLMGAHMMTANLSGAKLSSADLTDAYLLATNLSDADLFSANLTDATYAPYSSGPPEPSVTGIRGLSTLNVPPGQEIGLVQLRKLLQDAGLDDAAREATYSIQRAVTKERFSSPFWTFAWLLGVLRFVGLGVTTAYGLHPDYAIAWILLLGAILTPVYARAMLHPTAASGVVQVFPAGRLDGTAGNPAEEKEQVKKLVRAEDYRDALRSASYFSVISAVNIGFEQFTPGDWIRRLQAREYAMEAVGWVRVVAGAQALLSVYLLAMWALTQFGRPFG